MNLVTLRTLILASAASGCIIYDDKCGPNQDRDGMSEDGEDTGATDDEAVDAPEFWLTPASARVGDTLIVSLQSDQAMDYAAVEDLVFTGGISICSQTAREDELLLTLVVHEDADLGMVDLVIDFGSADRYFVEDAFLVLDADGSDGGSDGGSGGGDTGGDPAPDGGC